MIDAAVVQLSLISERESDDVYGVLVGELFAGWAPAAIIAAIFLATGLFISLTLGSATILALTLGGGLCSIAKLALIVRYQKRRPDLSRDRACAVKWEKAHAVTSIGFAMMIGALVAITFSTTGSSLHIVAMALLFGYASGIVARVSVRPDLTILLLLLAVAPLVLTLALEADQHQLVLIALLVAFLMGSFESVRHLHRAASRQIAMRLDMTTLAQNDPLTGLRNRLGLRLAFRQLFQSSRSSPMVAIHCLDLDSFKPVNDRYGHPVGDELLRQLAGRLKDMVQPGDIGARIGGDEFVVVQANIQRAEEAELFARRLARGITAQFNINEHIVSIGVSIGYATSPPGTPILDQLLTDADRALYKVKRGGGGVAAGTPELAVAG